MSDAPILFQELSAGSGKLGLVTLNVASHTELTDTADGRYAAGTA